jgi:hypothetical protein
MPAYALQKSLRFSAAAVFRPPAGYLTVIEEHVAERMPYNITLEYTEALLRQAVFAFWRRTVGTGFFVATALLVCLLAFDVWHGDRSWMVGALGGFLVFGLGFVLLIYIVHLRNTLARFRRMGAPSASLTLQEASFTMSSGLGSSSLQWASVTEIWRYPSFWLVLFSKAQFVTLPLACVPADAQAFILARVSAAGGKVDG